MKRNTTRLPMSMQLVLMFLVLAAGGAYFLVGQQAAPPVPSEQADWPWKVITESKLFLNGAPAGDMSKPKPLFTKIFNAIDLLSKRKAIGEFDRPSVFIVADPQLSMRRIAMLWAGIQENNGGPFLITSSALSQLPAGGRSNPLAMVVSTENVEPVIVSKLTKQKPGDVETAAKRISLTAEESTSVQVRTARTYNNSIEIASDGRFYVNEKNGTYTPPANYNPNFNIPDPPAIPLKQRLVTRAELVAVVNKAIDKSREGHKDLKLIVSEKAPWQSLLTLIETINDPLVEYSITVRMLGSWSVFDN